MKFNYLFILLFAAASLLSSCDEGGTGTQVNSQYFTGVEAATDPTTDVLVPVVSLEDNIISPAGVGFEQPAWTTFIQGVDQIFATAYTSAPEYVSYSVVDSVLVKGESFFTDLGMYAVTVVDDATMVLIGSARQGQAAKKIYLVNTNSMTIEKTVETTYGNDPDNAMLAFPSGVTVVGDKLFAAYIMMEDAGTFATPAANEAQVAVFSYPELEFEKIITDDRAPNIGRYFTLDAMQQDENGNIYTFSPSSLACGFAPVPETNSGVLRINAGETEFDQSFHIDFEEITGGYKINDMYYVANGKAVVRVLKEDETNADYLWATYAPTSELPLLETGILDLNAGTFTLLDDVPNAGGGWNSAYLVEGNKLYLGVSNAAYAGVYVIDVRAGTATEGALVDGNYAKAILSLNQI